MRKVIVESPYACPVKCEDSVKFFGGLCRHTERNVAYARLCLKDCFSRGEAPFASHLLYTQPNVLDDAVPEERKLGIEAGFEWRASGKATVVYTDLGISSGMEFGIEHAKKQGRPIEFRLLPKELLAKLPE